MPQRVPSPSLNHRMSGKSCPTGSRVCTSWPLRGPKRPTQITQQRKRPGVDVWVWAEQALGGLHSVQSAARNSHLPTADSLGYWPFCLTQGTLVKLILLVPVPECQVVVVPERRRATSIYYSSRSSCLDPLFLTQPSFFSLALKRQQEAVG